MRRTIPFITVLLAVMVLALPASAGSRRYAQDLLDDWSDYVSDEGFEVFYTDVDTIDTDHSINYYIELEPGYYYFIAEGGEDTEDIDMYIYDEDGYTIDSDTLSDNYPIIEVEISRAQEIEVEIIAFSFYERATEDYFCFVAASDPGSYTGIDHSSELDEILAYWEDWADDSGYEVLYSTTGSLNRDTSEFYEFELESGSYHVYAESLYEEDDIDLYVWDEFYDELGSDTLADNYPICSFDLRSDEYVEIEVVPYLYERGNSTDFVLVIAADGNGGLNYIDMEYDDTEAVVGLHEPVSDNRDWDYINELMDEYMGTVIDEDYEMIYDEIELIGPNDPRTIRITLGRGDYIIFGEGGLRVEDLDLAVYDENNYSFAEDTMTNNIPICEFSVRESTPFEIDVTAYSMQPGWSEGYYLLVIVRE